MPPSPITEYHSTTKRGLRWKDERGRAHFLEYNTLEFIVIHWWGDPAKSPGFDAIVRGLAVTYKVSANYVSEAGRLAQIAEPNILTWHAMSANRKSCAIENNPRCSSGDVLMCAKAIAHIWWFAGRKLPLKKHKEIVATACPGSVWSWWVDSGELYKLAEKVYDGKEIKMTFPQEIAETVWNTALENKWGAKYGARHIFASIDKNAVTAPARTWDELIQNKWGAKYGARHIFASIDKNAYDAAAGIGEANTKLDAVLERLQKLEGAGTETPGQKVALGAGSSPKQGTDNGK